MLTSSAAQSAVGRTDDIRGGPLISFHAPLHVERLVQLNPGTWAAQASSRSSWRRSQPPWWLSEDPMEPTSPCGSGERAGTSLCTHKTFTKDRSVTIPITETLSCPGLTG